MDRSELSRSFAKVLAYLACGKMEDARSYLKILLSQLRDLGLEA